MKGARFEIVKNVELEIGFVSNVPPFKRFQLTCAARSLLPGDLLKSTRALVTAEAKGRQSTISSAANVVPGQLLGSLAQHLQNKTQQQHEVLERVIFCRKRLAPLEQEKAQLEMIGMKDELKVNQAGAAFHPQPTTCTRARLNSFAFEPFTTQ